MIDGHRWAAAVGAIAVAAIIAGVALASADDDNRPAPATAASSPGRAQVADVDETLDAPDLPVLPDRGLHPQLREIDGWLQSDVTTRWTLS